MDLFGPDGMRLRNPEHKNAKFLLGVPQVIIILAPHVLGLTTPIFVWNCLCQVVELIETYAFGSLHLVLRPFPYSSAASRLEEGSRGICLLFSESSSSRHLDLDGAIIWL